MKTLVYSNNFENATNVINETKEERKAWYMQERTLARLLRIAQEKKMMQFTRPLFEKVGLPTNGKLTQTKYLTFVTNFVEISGKKYPAYVRKSPVYEKDESGKKCKRDKDGKCIQAKDAKGNLLFAYKQSAIKDGTWTLEKLLKAVCKEK